MNALRTCAACTILLATHLGTTMPAVAAGVDFNRELKIAAVWVETRVQIRWSDEKPVIGAKVFDHRSGALLGVTDGSGQLLLTVPNGTVLRMIDPVYGQQQALYLVQGTRKDTRQMMGTTSTSNFSATTGAWWEYF